MSRHHESARALLQRVTLSAEITRVEIDKHALLGETPEPNRDTGASETNTLMIELSTELRRRGIESKLILRSGGTPDPDHSLIELVASAHRWLDLLASGSAGSIREIAQVEGIDEADVSRFLPRGFLAPDIVEAIVTGTQSVELTLEQLRRACPLSYHWTIQRAVLVNARIS